MKKARIISAMMLGMTAFSSMPQYALAVDKEMAASDQEVAYKQNYVKVWGEVSEKTDERILIKNSSDVNDEIILNISEDTIIVDAVTGQPVLIKDINLNEGIYAYMGEAMTLSLPPMANAKAIIVNIPEDSRVPNYITVEAIKKNNDGSTTVIGDGGNLEATLNSDTNISPYLTRNIVTIEDIKVGSNLLLWEKENKDMLQITVLPVKINIEKCLIIPGDVQESEVIEITEEKGWKKENNKWYYVENGVKSKGWIKDNNIWYYLNNEGVMQTGWIQYNGKWYFLNEDGSMKTGWLLNKGDYYYLNNNGTMVHNAYVDGYYLGSNGAWIK